MIYISPLSSFSGYHIALQIIYIVCPPVFLAVHHFHKGPKFSWTGNIWVYRLLPPTQIRRL